MLDIDVETASQRLLKAQPVGKVSVKVALQRQLNVMHAVIMRDIRSRYFNHGLGFLIVPLFPVAHIAMLLGIYRVTGREAIFGDDMALFFATGLFPALTFTYISRYMSVSVVANKSMLSFPAVHLLDIVLARSFLEFIGIMVSMFVIYVILLSIGSDPIPRSPATALLALLSTIVLSIGVGIVVSVISAMLPMFPMGYALSMIVVYLSSGAPIYLHGFPEEVVYYCSFNPVFHAVEWMRSAYYLGYPTADLDKTYLMMWGFGSVAVGLLMERYLKQMILSN
ncbi:ABC transporter permease [Sinorhizobium sp. NFACC03]|uniref:ABC transporter permease n=1 Tax=Sinorhizobium sp. NFACC03 TaxID=1566295 RepID=UPI000891792E|nr:ABC transporter permease [Sinorhizobium sp. NFACC03]SDA99481.1 capsular polysaccharide transport system permease protein [Sinorhizobium sp. NFACC03]